jgi:hypothetical protein
MPGFGTGRPKADCRSAGQRTVGRVSRRRPPASNPVREQMFLPDADFRGSTNLPLTVLDDSAGPASRIPFRVRAGVRRLLSRGAAWRRLTCRRILPVRVSDLLGSLRNRLRQSRSPVLGRIETRTVPIQFARFARVFPGPCLTTIFVAFARAIGWYYFRLHSVSRDLRDLPIAEMQPLLQARSPAQASCERSS